MADLSKFSDEELQEMLSQKQKQKALSEMSDEQLQAALDSKQGLIQQLGQSTIENLPVYGAAAGGILGAAGGPITAMGVAGLGAAGGAALRDALKSLATATIENELRLPTQDEVLNITKNLGLEFAAGAVGEGAGQAVGPLLKAAGQTRAGQAVTKAGGELVENINKIPQKVAGFIRPAEKKLNYKEIIEAGKNIGVDITPSMLDKTDFVARLEYTLANSPSYLGQSVKAQQQAIEDALKLNIGQLTEGASTLSPFRTGNLSKAGMISETAQRLEPSAMAFQEVLESTKAIPVNEKSVNAIVRNIEQIPSYRLTKGAGKPAEFVSMLKNAENANDLKEVNSMLMAALRDKNLSSNERFVLSQMRDKIGKLEENSIMRSAIQQAKEGGMRESAGKKIGTEIVDTLKSARKEYRELSQDLQAVAKDAGLKVTNPRSFIDAVEELPSEKIQDKFFNVDNVRLLSNLKKTFPDQFELLKQGKLADILESSKNFNQGFGGDVSAQRFMTQIRNLSPEAQSMLFDDGAIKTINAIDLIQKNLPKNFNPSGSGSQLGWQDAIIKNLKDIPTYLLYKGASSNLANNVRNVLVKVPELMTLSKASPATFNGLVSRSVAILSQDKLSKMSEKGSESLKNAGFDSVIIEQLQARPDGRKILEDAAGVSPNSKAMDAIKKKIESLNLKRNSQDKYPMIMRKGGLQATIFSDQDYNEAKREGWK